MNISPEGNRDRVNRYRDRMRQAGFRKVEMWVPDTRSPEFKVQCSQQAMALRNRKDEHQAMDFIDEVVDWGEEE